MKVIFSTNLPSPYRVNFFNEFGKYCDLTVLYERKRSAERDDKWVGGKAEHFKEVYLNLKPYGVDLSIGHALKEYIRYHHADVLILTNYSSPATMEAITYCIFHKIPYFIEYDGGFNKKDKFPKNLIKKFLLTNAIGHLTSADEHKKYLMSLGISEDRIMKYPFTSIRQRDLNNIEQIDENEKSYLRNKLQMHEGHIVLTVGRFSYENGYGKGYDILMKAAERLDNNIGIYFVGDDPTDTFIKWKDIKKLTNVHFIGFKNKNELKDYYAAADIFVLMTRGDVWGLVINEAMMFGLPVITTTKCVAGLELIKDGYTGYLLDVEDVYGLVDKINYFAHNQSVCEEIGQNCRHVIQNYTIEKMTDSHVKLLQKRTSFKKTL